MLNDDGTAMNAQSPRWGAMYRGSAVVLLHTAVLFVVLNVLAWIGLRAAELFAPARSVVEDKYGASRLAAVYPDMRIEDVRQLLVESWGLQRVFQPYVQFREAPFAGRFVNVSEAGFRLSADQAAWPPHPAAFNIFVFGGSTSFGYGLPDAQTVPSQLQRVLRERGHGNVAVYNFGAGSYQSTQEKIYFQEMLISGHRPNMAVFLDGLNEFAFPHVPQDTALLQRMLGDKSVLRSHTLATLMHDVPLVRLAKSLASPTRPTHVQDSRDDEGLVDAAANRYLDNIRQIAAVAREAGVDSVFVLQPIPYYRYDTSKHPFFEPGGVNRRAASGYGRLRELTRQEQPLPAFHWAADMQAGLHEALYVDSVHYTAAMAHRLAEWIADRLDVGMGGPGSGSHRMPPAIGSHGPPTR